MPTGGAVASHASSTISKVLVANRGEIAVRVIRAAKDAGLPSVAVYAEPDADAPHVKLADEAFALGGQTSAESYLDFGKLLEAAEKSGANEEIPELFESATREAVAAFGRGECFVERYLDKPRHVEAQVIADTHGNVVVAGTRDCSLQRRFQKLVEEAPAPFLTDAQRKE